MKYPSRVFTRGADPLSQPVPSGRISGADGLRAIACLWVFFHHAGIEFDPQDLMWHTVFHDQGILGVAIFFVLSGMLLTIPFWQAALGQRPWPGLADYAKARLARVIPAYFVCVLACWAIFPAAPDRGLRILSAFTFTNWAHWRTFFPTPVSLGCEIANPSPVPPWCLFASLWACLKRLNIIFWFSSDIPIPVSLT